jgi:trans-2,3-dihydro-3-hydroxyanthranilate isomerase
VVLGLQHRLSAVRIEEKVGSITCLVDKLNSRAAHARFALPQLPEMAGKPPERGAMALALGLDTDEIGCGVYQPAVYSAGVLFYLVPVRDTRALARIKVNLGGWDDLFPLGTSSVYCFTTVDDEPDTELAARMFAPGMGLGEDPGTGAAAAALIGLLARHADFDEGQAEFRLRQGAEMGRPCRISLQLRKSGNALTHASIGGHAVIVGAGAFDLD